MIKEEGIISKFHKQVNSRKGKYKTFISTNRILARATIVPFSIDNKLVDDDSPADFYKGWLTIGKSLIWVFCRCSSNIKVLANLYRKIKVF